MTTKPTITDEEIIALLTSGTSPSQIRKKYTAGRYRVDRLRVEAVRRGHSPEHNMVHTVPDGYHVKGTSTLYKDGKPALQWVKSSIDHERQAELMRHAVEAMCKDVIPLKPIQHKGLDNDALCNLYTISDSHFGALAWRKENLDSDWDLKEAERVIVGCFKAMMDSAPDASTCIISELGDGLHHDGLLPVTPTSGHILSSDGRFGKMVDVILRVIRQLVSMALEKHRQVHLLIAEGNHNIASSIWLRKLFCALYADEPRITVDDSEIPYYVHQHGETMLAWHHGHLKKNDSLPLLFASQFPKEWGSSTKRYCHTGHRHHLEVKEHSGMVVTQHPTLAARDEHASRHGYLSNRAAICHTYHEKYGHVATNNVCPEMLER